MKEFLFELLTKDRGVSSKRLSALLALMAVLLTVVVDLFSDLTLTEHIFDGLLMIILGGLGLTSVDRMLGSKPKV